jgi:uncharacterized protein (UPF0332 family)
MTFDKSKVTAQKIDFVQINQVLQKAYKNIGAAEQVDEPDPKFSLAYDAMLQTALALMRARGYRPRTGLGHHQTLVDFSKEILGPKFHNLTSAYNQIKKKRHKLQYDISSVTKTEADSAIKVATKFFEAVENKIEQDSPQQKLWKPKEK